MIHFLFLVLSLSASAHVFELDGRYLKVEETCFFDLRDDSASLTQMKIKLPCSTEFRPQLKYKLQIDVGTKANGCQSKVVKSLGLLPPIASIPQYTDERLIKALQECRP